jgi:hypothetical protein
MPWRHPCEQSFSNILNCGSVSSWVTVYFEGYDPRLELIQQSWYNTR